MTTRGPGINLEHQGAGAFALRLGISGVSRQCLCIAFEFILVLLLGLVRAPVSNGFASIPTPTLNASKVATLEFQNPSQGIQGRV
jgi:hypothetical protein